ncbi:unnamed protein product [Cylindrotheca closterium]|uniref:Uncharacterized protein n=1 Tax=Cylindrotheca closterium TaxID=2856 RepID=A0AAD2CTL4_9STRA|nr:unnamed protein product [Cylindrotheca closterium]
MADYGYEDAAPDVAATNMKELGYEDAAPDVASNNMNDLGYEAASPDVAATKQVSAGFDLSLDDAKPKKTKKPKQKKGLFHSFQMAMGDSHRERQERGRTGRTPRRSSLKQEGKPRRSSIGYKGEIDVMLPGKSRPTRRRRSISFDQDNIFDIEPVTDMNPDKKEMWFQDEEYDVMQQKAEMTSQFVMMGGEAMAKKKNIETRGLEKLYDYENVAENQQMAYRSVFLEQGFQREEGEYNDEVVSCLYRVASMKSQANALARANADEADIEEYTRETRRRIRRSSM